MSCDAVTNSVDAALILQFEAGLADLPCPEGGLINGDDVVNSVDAELVLQFDVGLLDSLAPPHPAVAGQGATRRWGGWLYTWSHLWQ